MTHSLIDGAPASVEDLTYLAHVNYGAYTSFAVEGGAVRGLDLHLARLENAAFELFGEGVGEAVLRDLMRDACRDRPDGWMRVSLFLPELGPRTPDVVGRPRVIISVFDPVQPLGAAMRVQSQIYQREAAHLKHTATFGLIRARRMARVAGYDDALFVDASGRISEGSLWNIGFVRGRSVIWPQADVLGGVAQTLVNRGLVASGWQSDVRPVLLSDLSGFDGAFLCNSATPAGLILSVDDHVFDPEALPLAELQAAWSGQALQTI